MIKYTFLHPGWFLAVGELKIKNLNENENRTFKQNVASCLPQMSLHEPEYKLGGFFEN